MSGQQCVELLACQNVHGFGKVDRCQPPPAPRTAVPGSSTAVNAISRAGAAVAVVRAN